MLKPWTGKVVPSAEISSTVARAVAKAFGQSDVRAMEHNVSNCALYWHYLLGVWLVVFGLLFSGNNFEILLRICGFI